MVPRRPSRDDRSIHLETLSILLRRGRAGASKSNSHVKPSSTASALARTKIAASSSIIRCPLTQRHDHPLDRPALRHDLGSRGCSSGTGFPHGAGIPLVIRRSGSPDLCQLHIGNHRAAKRRPLLCAVSYMMNASRRWSALRMRPKLHFSRPCSRNRPCSRRTMLPIIIRPPNGQKKPDRSGCC